MTTEKAQFHDELDAHIAESMKDPEYAAAYRAAEERNARLLERPCSEGNCVELYDPETGESDSGWGPVGCPCQDDNPSAHKVIRPAGGAE